MVDSPSKQQLGSLIVFAVMVSASAAWAQSDAAAYENEIASYARELHKPNVSISLLDSIGRAYCQMKQARGGGPLHIGDATAALRGSNPETGAVPVYVQQGIMEAATKFLCPD